MGKKLRLNMSGKLRCILICLGLLLLTFGAGVLFGRCSRKRGETPPLCFKPDTTIIHDTIVDDKPKETLIPKGYELVPAGTLQNYNKMLAAYKDSLKRKPMLVEIHDTTYIAVPISEHTFTDDKTYKAVISGYDVKMIRHESFQETNIITKPVAVPPTFAISGGISAFGVGNVLGVGACVEASLRQGKWTLRPGIGYGLNYNGTAWNHGPYLRIDMTYNFYSK
ncbi:MAG: DUF6808 domain-containing protein [Agathobacter sp.]